MALYPRHLSHLVPVKHINSLNLKYNAIFLINFLNLLLSIESCLFSLPSDKQHNKFKPVAVQPHQKTSLQALFAVSPADPKIKLKRRINQHEIYSNSDLWNNNNSVTAKKCSLDKYSELSSTQMYAQTLNTQYLAHVLILAHNHSHILYP